MLRRAIALVRGKAIAGVNFVILHHHAVTVYLCHNACRSDGKAFLVTLDNALLRCINAIYRNCVDKDIIRGRGKLCQSLTHRLKGCL